MQNLLESAATFRNGRLPKTSFLVLAYVDLVLTVFAVGHGFREINPLLRAVLDDPGQLVLFKGIVPLFISWLCPARLLWPSTGLLLAVAAWNLYQLLLPA